MSKATLFPKLRGEKLDALYMYMKAFELNVVVYNDGARSVEISTMLQGDRRIVTQLPTVTLLNPRQNNLIEMESNSVRVNEI